MTDPGGTTTARPPIRIVSWNLKYGVEYHAAAELLGSHDRLHGADVVLLQEMDEAGTAHIAARLDAGYAYASAAPHAHTGRDFGNAIISRWPIGEATEIPLPHVARVSGQPRSATHGIVVVEGVQLAAYSIHTEIPTLGLRRRIEQFATLARHVAAADHEHVVIGGDFNTLTSRSRRALSRAMATAGLAAVADPAEPTYRWHRRDLALDHVFTSGWDVAAQGALTADETGALSDHRPLWVDLVSVSPGSST